MTTVAFNTEATRIPAIPAKTDYTLRITVFDPTSVAKTVTSSDFRATFRGAEGGRVLKTWHTSTNGGISIQSGPSGRIEIAVDASDLPPSPDGILELVEYSGGALSGDPTDRFRFSMPVAGGSPLSY